MASLEEALADPDDLVGVTVTTAVVPAGAAGPADGDGGNDSSDCLR